MRKVTVSAVILTALTGCGHNGGIPSTQWSFEIPAEDRVSSLALGLDSSNTTAGAFVSAVGNQAFTSQSAGKELGSVSSSDMMEPAFNQPPGEMKTAAVGLSSAGLSGRSGPDSSVRRLSNAGNGGSVSSLNLIGYQPVAVRPDPVAEVKAFLSANGSFDGSNSQELSHLDLPTSSLPTVYLPDPVSVTSTLGDPTNTESRVVYTDNASFTSTGLPVIESSVGGVYSSAGSSSLEPSTAALNQSWPTYPQMDYPTANAVTVPATLNDGLPVLEASSTREIPMGTAILQDLQRTEADQVMQNLSAEKNSHGSIDIEILPAVTISNDASVVSVGVTSDRANYVFTSAPR